MTDKLLKFHERIKALTPIKIIGIILATTIFFHFPSRFDPGNVNYQNQLTKSHKLTERAFEFNNPSSHAAKLETRLIIPAMIRFLKFEKTSLVIMALLSGVIFLWLIFKHYLALFDQLISFYLTLSFSFVYVGFMAFVEHRMIFDVLSLVLVFVAFNLSLKNATKTVSFILLFAALTNDERSVFTMMGFSILFLIKRDSYLFPILAALATFIYLFFRYYISNQMGIGSNLEGVGLNLLTGQMNNIRMGYVMGIEGFLILFYYWYKNQTCFSLFVNFVISIYIFTTIAAFWVVDISRSLAYWFPVVLILSETIKHETDSKRLKIAFYICLICVIIPSYYVSGKSSVWYNYSLPEQLFRMVLGRY